jgi:hypothetical protein
MFVALGGLLDDSAYTAQIEKTAVALVKPGEIVYLGDWQLYYAMKPRAGQVYYPYIVTELDQQEKASISVAFMPATTENCAGWLANTFGGHWSREADLQAPQTMPIPSSLIGGFKFNYGFFFGTQLSAYRREVDLPKATVQGVQPIRAQ